MHARCGHVDDRAGAIDSPSIRQLHRKWTSVMPLCKTNQTIRSRRSTRARLLVTWQLVLSVVLAPVMLTGCAASHRQWEKTVGNETCEIDCIAQQIDNPSPHVFQQVSMTSEPVTALSVAESDIMYVDRTLDEVLQQAMEHSTVLRDIGGVVLRFPNTVRTQYATQLFETDPQRGMEAALSAFDAQLAASSTFNNNNRIYNNSFFAGGASAFSQDLHDYQVEVSKRTATGSSLAVRGVSIYDGNNAPANTFTTAWDSWLEGEIRQPLLQGGGLEFNRIAGPGATPGVYNGVLIAKANSDINYAEFMTSLRDYVSNVENAYWDLYLAYRELDARKKAMEKALVIWNEAKAKDAAGSFEIAEEALARQQYYQLKADVDDALSGRLLQGTQTQNGSSGGTVQIAGGVLAAERRLRLLTGLPASDGQLIRPQEEPTMANIQFEWHSCMNETVNQRPELQRQHIAVKKREMELLAAKNFLNPRLDAIGRYRWRGFGDDLIGSGTQTGSAPASAFGNLATGQQQEWTLGVELTVPIGYRKAHAAVQHAELALARERAIQKEQQREVVSNLSGAIADAVRAYQSVQNNLNQYIAAKEYLKALDTRKENAQRDGTDRILDAQRRLVQAEIQFFRSRAEYAVSLKNVHFEKGSLLRYRDLRIAGVTPIEHQLIQQEPIIGVEPYETSSAVDMTVEQPAGVPAVPETAVPETTVPETAIPENAVPETAVPEPAIPETEVPETTGEGANSAAASPVGSRAVSISELAPMIDESPAFQAAQQTPNSTRIAIRPSANPDARRIDSPENKPAITPSGSRLSAGAVQTEVAGRPLPPADSVPVKQSGRGKNVSRNTDGWTKGGSRIVPAHRTASAPITVRKNVTTKSTAGDPSSVSGGPQPTADIGATTPVPGAATDGPMTRLDQPIGATTPLP